MKNRFGSWQGYIISKISLGALSHSSITLSLSPYLPLSNEKPVQSWACYGRRLYVCSTLNNDIRICHWKWTWHSSTEVVHNAFCINNVWKNPFFPNQNILLYPSPPMKSLYSEIVYNFKKYCRSLWNYQNADAKLQR